MTELSLKLAHDLQRVVMETKDFQCKNDDQMDFDGWSGQSDCEIYEG